MPPTTFATAADNLKTTLGADYTLGSGVVALSPGYGAIITAALVSAGLPPISSAAPLRHSLCSARAINAFGQLTDRTKKAVYLATGLSGDSVTGVTVEAGSTDQNFRFGDVWSVDIAARAVDALQTAVNALETTSGSVVAAPYITQTPVGTLTGSQALSALGTGLLKNTTGTGVLTVGTADLDYRSLAGASWTLRKNTDGSYTRTYTALGVTVHIVFTSATVTTLTYSGNLSHVKTVTRNADGSYTTVVV